MSKLVPLECELKHDTKIIAHPSWLGRGQMEALQKRLEYMLAYVQPEIKRFWSPRKDQTSTGWLLP